MRERETDRIAERVTKNAEITGKARPGKRVKLIRLWYWRGLKLHYNPAQSFVI